MTSPPFSAALRAATRDRHAEAEQAAFLADLLAGRLDVTAYARYAEQLWFVYRALEDGAVLLAGDPVAGPVLRPELPRVPALERDLAHLLGPDWRDRAVALPATRRYVARITEVAATWPAGYVAHHYTRYLGDLSGGQVIRGVVQRAYGIAPGGDGVRFHVFDGIANPAAFRRSYRAALDALPLPPAEQVRVLAEANHAFALNTALLTDLTPLPT